MKETTLRFEVLMPHQNPTVPVFSFAAKARDVARIARIERAGRDGTEQDNSAVSSGHRLRGILTRSVIISRSPERFCPIRLSSDSQIRRSLRLAQPSKASAGESEC
jgi:hypothetical protein